MQIRILGCSGGIGKGLATTSLMIDQDILLDAGTGVADLTLDEMLGLRHIFITHSHLDHIASVALLVDTLFGKVSQPLTVHALQETIDALKEHIFNWTVWPDFSLLPDTDNAVIRFMSMRPGEVLDLGARSIEMIPVHHTVPAVGYRVSSNGAAFAFSGDTTTNDSLWAALNAHPGLDMLIVEAAFPEADIELSKLAGHYCPSLLAADLKKLRHRPVLCISHPKPGEEARIIEECRALLPEWDLRPLSCGDTFQL